MTAGGWELIAAAQAGDRDAFGQLYTRYAPGVSRFVGSRLRDRALAEDVTSETFARALRRIDSVTDQGRDAGAWFTTIARNLITDHVKSSRVQRETVTAEFDDTGTDQDTPEQAAIRTQAAADVRRRVAQLPTDQQECIRLRYFQDLSVAETAAVMGRNDGAVKALAHRGLEGLRASMAKDARTVAPTREAVPRSAGPGSAGGGRGPAAPGRPSPRGPGAAAGPVAHRRPGRPTPAGPGIGR
jgi:RNA polymerase sigma-70 factor (ECF subfamily)